MDSKLPRLNSSTGGLSISIGVVTYLLFNVIALSVISLFKLSGTEAAIYISYLAPALATLTAVAVTIKYSRVSPRAFFPVKCNPLYYLAALLLIFGLMFSLLRVNDLFTRLLKLIFKNYTPSAGQLPPLEGFKIIPAILVIAVIPAFAEEAMFRCVLLKCCHSDCGTVRTVLLVGFCFALFHTAPEQTVYQFICGCSFALLTIRSGSPLPAVVIHFLNNAAIIIMSAAGALDANGALIISYGGEIALTVVSAVALVGAVLWLIFDGKPLLKGSKGSVKNFFMFASVGIAVLALFWILKLFGV